MSNPKLNANEVWMWLLENNYVEITGGRWILTGEFHNLVENNPGNPLPVPVKSVSLLPTKKEAWDKSFMDFILEAQIPARWEDSHGQTYYLNKFSEDGLKVFKKALESGVIYDVLVKSTMLYYKSSTRFKKTIGNYLKQGDWKTDYEALMLSAEGGKEGIESHIKQEINSNVNRTQYKIG